MRNLTHIELLEINGGHKGAAYRAGKAVADAIQDGWNHVKEFAGGFWEGLTS
ncbi:hypothetical protein [Riemerella anatipestifer]|uniref:hypothetical protein n=1 Tax=Riemerella anatipestifer TaxID=34085 RepID=UPI0023648C3D|nr:hypothetical protein [Riemerella anatipestifer]